MQEQPCDEPASEARPYWAGEAVKKARARLSTASPSISSCWYCDVILIKD